MSGSLHYFAALGTLLWLPGCEDFRAQQPPTAQTERADWWPGTSSVLEEERFPPAFLGKWGLDDAACKNPDRPDRITIYPRGIDAYESGERLRQITTIADRTVRVRLDVEGESVFDVAEYALRISEDKQRLHVRWTSDAPEQAWVRCTSTN